MAKGFAFYGRYESNYFSVSEMLPAFFMSTTDASHTVRYMYAHK
jgi:hypothetical protein